MKVFRQICVNCDQNCPWLWPQNDFPNSPLVCHSDRDDVDISKRKEINYGSKENEK